MYIFVYIYAYVYGRGGLDFVSHSNTLINTHTRTHTCKHIESLCSPLNAFESTQKKDIDFYWAHIYRKQTHQNQGYTYTYIHT